ncbi:MAG TPA: NADP-dependent malic enzyme [Tepiditoga sp.]|nr:NADP-dependent malic enzyme [Thermotogota bacterium]HOO75532.1 NADP-dependent malic enzyme [Tepiditoga sp.]
MNINEESLKKHEEWKGKLEIKSKAQVNNSHDLAVAYTPGVAQPCIEIHKDRENVYKYTMKGNTVAVVTDGSAVLGLGNIGPEAALPVMEGKCVLFKEFGDVNAIPVCLDTQDTEEIIKTVKIIAPAFGGINLEDISAPRCFEIEERLKKELNIPVFHDDQHGTAIVVLAALINALKLTGKNKENIKLVINGSGSAGIAITKLLKFYGVENIILCDRNGILTKDDKNKNEAQNKIAKEINPENITGDLSEAMKNADVFIGVSGPDAVNTEMVKSMNMKSIIFAMANPMPEIMPDKAKEAGAYIVGTGRSDFPNQINNVLVFPGIFRGAIKARIQITEEIKIRAAKAIASMVDVNQLNPENILPKAFQQGIAERVAREIMR